MKKLEEKILSDGQIIMPDILKVDGFLNHQIDVTLYQEMGKEFKARFSHKDITKIVTIEASGIGIALATAYEFDNIPVVFAKKGHSATINDQLYTSSVHSFTKKVTYNACIKKDYINEGDKILIIDDFLANGHAALGLIDICKQGGATIQGVGIVIEKGFQPGRKAIEATGVQVESLAIIDQFIDGKIKFK